MTPSVDYTNRYYPKLRFSWLNACIPLWVGVVVSCILLFLVASTCGMEESMLQLHQFFHNEPHDYCAYILLGAMSVLSISVLWSIARAIAQMVYIHHHNTQRERYLDSLDDYRTSSAA